MSTVVGITVSNCCASVLSLHVKNPKPTVVTSDFCQAGLIISYFSTLPKLIVEMSICSSAAVFFPPIYS